MTNAKRTSMPSVSLRRSVYLPLLALTTLIAIWQLVSSLGVVPPYLLPSPLAVLQSLIADRQLLLGHIKTTLIEAFVGLSGGVLLGVACALVMDAVDAIYEALHPLIVITQTVPAVALAPLLVLWFGYGLAPKIILVIITCFFPITIGFLEGLRSVDVDTINLMRAMGSSRLQILWHAKIPAALSPFFSGLKISAAYAIVGAVIAEWLGGFSGLGVYMTRVRKAYAFDKMFGAIFLISALSLSLIWLTDKLRSFCMPWQRPSSSDRAKHRP